MNLKLGRNESCPCGSGKKFKRCCIDKINGIDDEDFSNPMNIKENYKKIRKSARIKQCLHPNKGACSEKIISAHSIQNNKIIKQISNNGLVYMPCPKADNPFLPMTEYGRKEATVFTGFCGYHDKILFQPIEDNLFVKSEEQIFLYTYRSFAVEYHKKQEIINMQQNIFDKKPSLLHMPKGNNPFLGMHLALNDFRPVKAKFDKALLDGKYDILTSVIWEFNQPVNFAGTGFEAMSRDLKGNEIQNLQNIQILAKHIFVTVFPESEKTYCIISWLKEKDDIFSEYFTQLQQLNEQQKRNYINNLLPMISENIVINPKSWDMWEENKKNEFSSLIWGMETLAETSGIIWDRLESPAYDLFEL